jgi:hypothetical protein
MANMIRYRGKYREAYHVPDDGPSFEDSNIEQRARRRDLTYFWRECVRTGHGDQEHAKARLKVHSSFLPKEFGFD